jgi:hypothetical protein
MQLNDLHFIAFFLKSNKNFTLLMTGDKQP